MKRFEQIKRDNLLVDFILEHKGRENAVSRYEIAQFLTEQGYPYKAEAVHGLLERIIKQRRLPICSVKGIIGRNPKRIL